jgi:hypothetical protein
MKALNEEQERLEEEAEWPRFVIDHESQWYIYWVGLMTLCGFYSCFIVGYQVCAIFLRPVRIRPPLFTLSPL